MSALSQAIYDVITSDATMEGLLSTYRGGPAFFTVDPAPGDATMPYGVSAGAVFDSTQRQTAARQRSRRWRNGRERCCTGSIWRSMATL